MPYRHAHYYLLLLFPLTGLAFWPNYFSKFTTSPYAFHVHGVTASLWIALLAFQSWTIHRRRNALHRSAGLASFMIFPFFLVGGLLVLQTMAVKFGSRADPFYSMFGARLGAVDALSSLAIPCFFYMALKWRRKVNLHARYMIAPILFLLAPIFSRLTPALPIIGMRGPEDLYRFVWHVHLGNGIAVAVAAILYLRAPKHGRPFLLGGGLIVAQSLLFETLGRTGAWENFYVAMGALPTPLILAAGLAAGIAATWAGWNAVPAPRRTTAGAPT